MPKLKLFNDIRLQVQCNWEVVSTLLTPPLLNDIIDYFLYTRSYQDGLDFLDRCYPVLEQAPDKDQSTKAFVHDTIITMRLVLYDKLNLWDRYIKEYDAFQPMLASTIKDADRYHMLHRKLNMLYHGKNVESMKCHQRYELTDDELQKRYEYVIRKIQRHLGGLQNGKSKECCNRR